MTNRRTLASVLGTLALAAATAMPSAALAAVGPLELLKDIQSGATGSFPSSFVVAGNTVYFVADDGVNGSELWKSDGTPAGTVLVKDIRPGATGSSPAQLAMAGGTLFFRADDGVNGAELWKSDGTGPGTVMVKDINPGAVPSSPTSVTAIGNTVFFAADTAAGARELWKSDGTGPGTVTVAEISPGTGDANPRNFAVMNGTLFFVANDPVAAAELFRSDGTVEGTLLVKDIRPGNVSSNLTGLVAVGGTLFFWASDGTTGMELWKSDGTDAGTVRVRDITAGAGGTSFGEAVAFDGRLFFVVTDATSGSELWTSDGTEAGTTLFKEIAAGAAGSSPATLTVSGSRLFFVASDGTTGRELWTSDGTPGGTALVKDINPTGGSFPASLVPINGMVYFAADDGTAGREVWRSDGTAVGTLLLAEVVPGAAGATPAPAVMAGGRLFLTAVAAEGLEAWVIPVGLPDPMSFPAVPPASGMVDSFAPVTVTGVDHLVSISVERVSGLPDSDPQYSIGCTGTWTSLPGLVGNGQAVCVRHWGGSPPLPVGYIATESVLVVGPSRVTFSSRTLAYFQWTCSVSSSFNGTAYISGQGRSCGLSPLQPVISLLEGSVNFALAFDPGFQRPYEWLGACSGKAGSDTSCLLENVASTGSIGHTFTFPTTFSPLTTGPGTLTTDPPLETTGFGSGWWPNAKYQAGFVPNPLRPVSITAVPQPGAVLVALSYDQCPGQDCSCNTQAGTCTAKILPNAAVNYLIRPRAVFGYELGIARAGDGEGSVNAASATKNVDCGAACTVAFPAGEVVTLTPSPEAGSSFLGWSGAGCTGTGTCVVTMDAARGVTATFATGLAGDSDGDGIPDGIELAEGRDPATKDNDVFGNARFFAMQMYRDFLNREGDPAGITGWTDLVTAGTYSRNQVIDAFLQSQEFSGFVAPVVRLYFATFLRVPDYDGLTFNAGLVRNGTVTLNQLADFFTSSPEFVALYGSLDNTQFVTLLYDNILGRAPDQAGLDGWVALLDGGMTRGQVLLGFSDSAEYQAAMANEVFVAMMYAGMLRRTPEPSGFTGWVNFLDAGTYSREQVINGFFLSSEYRARFLP